MVILISNVSGTASFDGWNTQEDPVEDMCYCLIRFVNLVVNIYIVS